MGNTLSCCKPDDPKMLEFLARYPNIFDKNQKDIVMLGQYDAGTKTLIYTHLAFNQEIKYIPAIGANMIIQQLKSTKFTAIYLSPNTILQRCRSRSMKNVKAVILMLDSTDLPYFMDRLIPDLKQNLADKALEGLPILVFASKSDLPHAQSVKEIDSTLRLGDITDAPYFIQSLNALTGEGLDAGFMWLDEQLKPRYIKKAE